MEKFCTLWNNQVNQEVKPTAKLHTTEEHFNIIDHIVIDYRSKLETDTSARIFLTVQIHHRKMLQI